MHYRSNLSLLETRGRPKPVRTADSNPLPVASGTKADPRSRRYPKMMRDKMFEAILAGGATAGPPFNTAFDAKSLNTGCERSNIMRDLIFSVLIRL